MEAGGTEVSSVCVIEVVWYNACNRIAHSVTMLVIEGPSTPLALPCLQIRDGVTINLRQW